MAVAGFFACGLTKTRLTLIIKGSHRNPFPWSGKSNERKKAFMKASQKMKSVSRWMRMALLLSFVLSACGGGAPAGTVGPTYTAPPYVEDDATLPSFGFGSGATEEPTTDIGTEAHPIKVLFVPSVDTTVIVTGGEVMADALNAATGLFFEVSVPTSYAATIEETCASPDDTMAFIPALGYVLASDLCGVDVSFKAVRFGFPVYWAQFLVARDSDIDSLEDLDGLTWGYGSITSGSGYLAPLVTMNDLGITPSEAVETGGHNQSALAVYNGEVDFATT